MMNAAQLLPVRSTLSGRWQLPALMGGVAILVVSLARIAQSHRTFTFEEKMHQVAQLREAGALERAHAYLMHLLVQKDATPAERSEIHRLLVLTIYQAEACSESHAPDNARAIIKNFQLAMQLGAKPAALEWRAMGDASDWLQRKTETIEAFREAINLGIKDGDHLHRRLFSLEMTAAHKLTTSQIEHLDSILDDEHASADNKLWAVDTKLEWLFDQSQAQAALDLVNKMREQLAGAEQKLALTYYEALCLWHLQRNDEAENILRSFRHDWTPHDQLWARAGWLLGKLQQEDGRPQEALSFYDEVSATFKQGNIFDNCEFGRAESFALLQRFDEAFNVFEVLASHAGTHEETGLDADALRTSITTIGESLLSAEDWERGLGFLQLAKSLTPSDDNRLTGYYAARIADISVRLARVAKAQAESKTEQSDANLLLTRAAENYIALAQNLTTDEHAATRAWMTAADLYDLAGQPTELITTLQHFLLDRPTSDQRSRAYYRLAQAYQSLQQYHSASEYYHKVITEFPRLADATASMVPLAQCLIEAGGDAEERGIKRLIDIVDDRGPEALFAPKAREYKQALLLLAEYYSRAGDEKVPGHLEKAISRLEDAISLYPDDKQIFRLRYLLADAYRQSAIQLASDDAAKNPAIKTESISRYRSALRNYQDVKKILAPRDADDLNGIQQRYLRASYLFIGDCYFELAEYDAAIEAYREAAWRFENFPAAVAATLQVAHCFQRLGQASEARAAVARMQWLLKKIPDSAFDAELGMSPKSYWMAMAQRMEQAGIY